MIGREKEAQAHEHDLSHRQKENPVPKGTRFLVEISGIEPLTS